MNPVEAIATENGVRAALTGFRKELEAIIDQIVAIQQIPSPTFAEERRARYMEERFRAIGLCDISRDSMHNVFGRLPGRSAERPPLIISAHLDTVFPLDTHLDVRREASLVYGPGIGDNSTGLAGLLLISEAILRNRLEHAADIIFVANVGEEGLGDLRGMRAIVDRFGAAATYVVVEGGLYGQLTHEAIGVRRYRVDITTPGGHSWGGFGSPSAIHVLGRLIAAIDELVVPSSPKTTYNVGLIEGGTSINTIANSARFWLDLRSEDEGALGDLIRVVQGIVHRANESTVGEGNSVQVEMVCVGSRPAGRISRRSPIVATAEAALRLMGCQSIHYIVSSTDANIPLSRGYQAVCLGLAHSGNSHRPDEFVDVTYLPAGLGQLLLVALAAAR